MLMEKNISLAQNQCSKCEHLFAFNIVQLFAANAIINIFYIMQFVLLLAKVVLIIYFVFTTEESCVPFIYIINEKTLHNYLKNNYALRCNMITASKHSWVLYLLQLSYAPSSRSHRNCERKHSKKCLLFYLYLL